MVDDRLKTPALPIMDEFSAAIEGKMILDRVISEQESRQLLPELLLQAKALGISAPNFGSAVRITDAGVISIASAEIIVNSQLFTGKVTLSADLYNDSPGALASRNVKVKVEGGNMITRAAADALIKGKLGNPQKSLSEGLNTQINEKTGGRRRLGSFRADINGREKTVKLHLGTVASM